MVKFMLKFLWFIGFVVAGYIVYEYFCYGREVSLLGAFAILISAGIASMSVMRSIKASEDQQTRNAIKNKRSTLLALNMALEEVKNILPEYSEMHGGSSSYVPHITTAYNQLLSKNLSFFQSGEVLFYLGRDATRILESIHKEVGIFTASIIKNKQEEAISSIIKKIDQLKAMIQIMLDQNECLE